ncbi:ferritin-like domain-containing protein [Methylophaga sp. OBS3]|uniref:ferritin-like domain-containing protein n=1 Tax=Methylophaga sp. OBS3 TaxID=2991934 RepID=UPI00225030BC|nr:ferritin-like domain-containing protein [Methylophaga sp. OBS3]MCX4189381.1 ferritin-like domain-containing protein [Methylophaga sp. OBS3]
MIELQKLNLRQQALAILLIENAADKAIATRALATSCQQHGYELTREKLTAPHVPGRPSQPELVNPKNLPRRRNSSETGHASLIHAICHIEFNAINLALDAIARFEDMPEAYYADWLQVADEEAKHFQMLSEHLADSGFAYGDFSAHDGLWEMAQKTHHDPLLRMALVPRVLEARGLDVTPKMMEKLTKSGDHRAVEILNVILEEEIGHVAVGTRWFNYLCDQRSLEPLSTFTELLESYFDGAIRGPFHIEARQQAGFTEAELAWLEQQR